MTTPNPTSGPAPSAVRLDQIIALNDEIIALVRADVPLELGLAQLGRDREGALARISTALAGRMSRGESLSEALAAEKRHFPRVYRAVVEAGIQAGRLPAALEAVSRYASMLAEIRQKIGLAFLYPLILCALVYGLFVVLAFDVVKRFQETYFALRLETHGAVQFLGGCADTLMSWVWIPPLALLLLLVWWARTDGPQLMNLTGFARPLGWIPGMKRIGFNFRCANFAEVLRLLVEHGVTLPDAIVLAAETTAEPTLQGPSQAIAECVTQGGSLEEKTPGLDGLPPYLRWLIVRGHRQGTLPRSLRLAADTYRRRALHQAAWLKLSFPILACVVIGGGVTLLYALGLFLPLVDMLHELAA